MTIVLNDSTGVQTKFFMTCVQWKSTIDYTQDNSSIRMLIIPVSFNEATSYVWSA